MSKEFCQDWVCVNGRYKIMGEEIWASEARDKASFGMGFSDNSVDNNKRFHRYL
jgi:hypothetical protein